MQEQLTNGAGIAEWLRSMEGIHLSAYLDAYLSTRTDWTEGSEDEPNSHTSQDISLEDFETVLRKVSRRIS